MYDALDVALHCHNRFNVLAVFLRARPLMYQEAKDKAESYQETKSAMYHHLQSLGEWVHKPEQYRDFQLQYQ